jgi:hypothetical protein
MPRGGKRAGAGRKPRHSRYKRRASIGRDALAIGQRCEVLWREAYKTNWHGFHLATEPRPRAHKRIIRQVATEFGEKSLRMVERLWKDYRRLEADLRNDLSSAD